MSTVLERVEQAHNRKQAEERARRRDADVRFASLVTVLADGGEEDASAVLDVLDAAGRTVEELSAAVQFRVDRVRAAALLAELPAAEARVTSASNAVAKLEDEKRAALAKLDAQIAEAKRDHKQAVADLDPFHAAREHLTSTAPADLQREHLRFAEQIAANGARLGEIADQIRFASDKLEKGLVFASVGHAGYDTRLREYYSASERAALTTDRYAWVSIEQHAREQVERTAHKWNEWLALAASRGIHPSDSDDRGNVVRAEQERRVREITAECRGKWVAEIEKLNAEAAALRRQMPRLQEQERNALEAMLVP